MRNKFNTHELSRQSAAIYRLFTGERVSVSESARVVGSSLRSNRPTPFIRSILLFDHSDHSAPVSSTGSCLTLFSRSYNLNHRTFDLLSRVSYFKVMAASSTIQTVFFFFASSPFASTSFSSILVRCTLPLIFTQACTRIIDSTVFWLVGHHFCFFHIYSIYYAQAISDCWFCQKPKRKEIHTPKYYFFWLKKLTT